MTRESPTAKGDCESCQRSYAYCRSKKKLKLGACCKGCRHPEN